ncbi:translation initiation factor IF-3 [Candidatus Dependentiae bacterium]|nr:translation initiation factor IF-3 [Candidatus Dependentiae bacterium]
MKGRLQINVNNRIRAKRVLVIGPAGKQYGEKSISEALEIADEIGLDLVEVSPNANPPVCKIMDFGKYKYDLDKKRQKSKKKQKKIVIKEIQFRPKTGEHDYQFKKDHIEKFLKKGYRIKVIVYFRGRELSRIDLGEQIITRITEELGDLVEVIQRMPLEGRRLGALVGPSKLLIEQIEKELKDEDKSKNSQRHKKASKDKGEEQDKG